MKTLLTQLLRAMSKYKLIGMKKKSLPPLLLFYCDFVGWLL